MSKCNPQWEEKMGRHLHCKVDGGERSLPPSTSFYKEEYGIPNSYANRLGSWPMPWSRVQQVLPRKLGVSSSQLGTVTFAGTQELQLSSTNFLSIYPISITVCIMEDSKVCLFSPLLPWKGLKPVNNHLSLGNIFLPRFSMRLSGLVHT